MKITVLAGGLSPERDVSLSSGSLIANALIDKGHQVALVDVYEGLSVPFDGVSSLFYAAADGHQFSYKVPEKEPDLEDIRRKNGNRRELVGPGVLDLCRASDVVFLALHGAMGENGQIQAFFDVLGIPYTGSGYAGCLLAMDKDVTKRLLVRDGIPTADWVLVQPDREDRHTMLERIRGEIGFPCVVKPLSCGSSVGVSMVTAYEELEKALDEASLWESRILVEKKITGREFSIGIFLDRALPSIEIIPVQGFYDYANKYQGGRSREICPADLPPHEESALATLALSVHRCLQLGSYSRIDFIRDEKGVFWCLEANTLPGMTPTSLLPQEARATGISYGDLCEAIAAHPV